ncbi:MAG: carbohydrate ABC transporter permease [Saccharofermentanales bacterium]
MDIHEITVSAHEYFGKWFESIKGMKRFGKYKKSTRKFLWSIFRGLFLFGMSFVLLYPLLISLSVSLRGEADLFNPAVIWIPRNVTILNILNTIEEMDYWNALRNTMKLSFVSVLLQVISCAVVGYGFARFRFRFKGLFFGLVIFTIIVPPQVIYIPNYLMYKDFDYFGLGTLIGLFTGNKIVTNLLNTPYVMYLPALLGVGIRSGLFIYIFNQFYRNLPKDLEDAAYIDGCGYYRTFLKIILPNAKTVMLTVFLFSLVWYWNDYFVTSMYINTNTVSTALAILAGVAINIDAYMSPSLLQSGCLLVMLPLLLIYLCFERFFTEGIERTGIVG